MSGHHQSSRYFIHGNQIGLGELDLAKASLDALDSNIAVIDTSGTIILVNEAWRNFALNNGGYGQTLEAGGDYLEVVRQASVAGEPYSTRAYNGLRALLTGETRHFKHEYPCHSAHQERWFLMQGTPLIREGRIYGAVLNHLDITERYQAERSLQRSEQRFIEIASTIDEVIWIRTKQQVIYVNDSYTRIWGQSSESLYADPQSFFKAIHPEDRPQVVSNHQQCSEQGHSFTGTYRVIRPDGEIRWIDEREFPVHEESGEVIRFVGSARDITEQKNLQIMLEGANRVKTDFLNSVSHDLRTPLNAILGFTELLEKSSGLDATQRHYLSLCRRAGFRLHGLIDTLLELSRLESGNLQLRDDLFNLRKFLHEQIELLTYHAEEKGLDFSSRLDDDIPEYVHGDEVRFGQILFNLAINAIKFTEHGRVDVHAGLDNNNLIRITVTDSGPGIPPQEQLRIFEPFFQLGSSGSRKLGTGLGLTISRELSRLMGGDLWMESVEGEGSQFSFSVALRPAAAPAQHPAQPSPRSAPETSAEPPDQEPPCHAASLRAQPRNEASSSAPRRGEDTPCEGTPSEATEREDGLPTISVLVAEDDQTNAMLVQIILEQLGASVSLVPDGQQALKAWREGSFDLLLLDIQMPNLDGQQAVEEIRRQESSQGMERTHIAMLTAHAGEQTRYECEQAGADTFLTKPVQRHDLLATLRWASKKKAKGA